MKEKMLEFLEKGQLPIYFEEKQIIREFIETFFDHYQRESSKQEDVLEAEWGNSYEYKGMLLSVDSEKEKIR